MRLKQIADFLTVVNSGSIRAAARTLGLSQPAITRSLRRLETDLGAQLLERTPQGILLTPRGRVFYGRARVAHAELAKARAEVMEGQTDGGPVTFGVGPTVGSLVVPQAVGRFRNQFPMVQVRIVEGLSIILPPS